MQTWPVCTHRTFWPEVKFALPCTRLYVPLMVLAGTEITEGRGGGGEGDRQTDRQTETDIQRDRERQTDRQTDRERQRDRPTDRDRAKETETETERVTETDRGRETEPDRHTETSRQTDREGLYNSTWWRSKWFWVILHCGNGQPCWPHFLGALH